MMTVTLLPQEIFAYSYFQSRPRLEIGDLAFDFLKAAQQDAIEVKRSSNATATRQG